MPWGPTGHQQALARSPDPGIPAAADPIPIEGTGSVRVAGPLRPRACSRLAEEPEASIPRPRRHAHMTHPTEDKGYRLPAHVRPSAYDADVVIEPAARRFAGRIRITLGVSRPTDELVLHAAELELEAVAVSAGGRERTPVEQRLAPASETVVLR